MAHKVVIVNKLREAFSDSGVRAAMSSAQCAEIDSILQSDELTPKQFRELTHRLNRIYCQDD